MKHRFLKLTLLNRIGLIFMFAMIIVFVIFKISHRNVSDGRGPQITVSAKERTVSIHDSEGKLLKGVQAEDSKDGNVTDSLTVANLSSLVDGKRIVTYAAFDSDHNVSRATAQIRYSDYSHPQIEMKRPLAFGTGEDNYLKYVTARDCIDGDISGNVDITSKKEINTETAGTYQVSLSVSNSAGDTTTIPATLEIYDNGNRPQMELRQYVVYLKKGDSFHPKDYLKNTKEDGISQVEIDNPVHTDRTGAWQVTYTGKAAGKKTHAYLTVVVSDQNVM